VATAAPVSADLPASDGLHAEMVTKAEKVNKLDTAKKRVIEGPSG
jgi:hypothetical protein